MREKANEIIVKDDEIQRLHLQLEQQQVSSVRTTRSQLEVNQKY